MALATRTRAARRAGHRRGGRGCAGHRRLGPAWLATRRRCHVRRAGVRAAGHPDGCPAWASTSLAADAWELDLLVDAGVDLVRVPLPSGPVFHNHERPEGRIQTSLEPGTRMPVEAVPRGLAGRAVVDARARGQRAGDAWAGQPSSRRLCRPWLAGHPAAPRGRGARRRICRPDRRRSCRVPTSWASAATTSRGTWRGTRSSAGCGPERRCSDRGSAGRHAAPTRPRMDGSPDATTRRSRHGSSWTRRAPVT